MKLSIVIACFNERPTILKAIDEAKALDIDKEIIVIDNCSTDGTKEILKDLKKDSLKIVMQPKNFGCGQSCKLGGKLAKGDYVYFPCADLEYKMSDVYRMIKKLEYENLDVVFGSRLLERRNTSRLDLIRERPYWLGSIIATFITNMFYGRHFTDIIAPKLIKIAIFKGLDCKANGQAFEFELASKLCKKGYKIGEIGISYRPRSNKEGKTIRAIDMIPALLAMARVKLFG